MQLPIKLHMFSGTTPFEPMEFVPAVMLDNNVTRYSEVGISRGRKRTVYTYKQSNDDGHLFLHDVEGFNGKHYVRNSLHAMEEINNKSIIVKVA